jgi:hypothetical protein
MSLTYKKQKVTRNILVDAACDRCGEYLSVEDGDLRDGGVFTHSFSYASPKYPCGDMHTVICEPCILEIFHFAKFSEDPC